MADKRTVFPIPADTWVKVVDGETEAKIYKNKQDATYYSFAGTAATDTPATTIPLTPTKEKMFQESVNEFVSDSALVYVWVRCSPGQVGSVIVTL